jgi:PleD family two-component response regulator
MTTFATTSLKPTGTILCIDDDDDDASLLETAVNSYNDDIRFIKCYGGKEAIAFLKRSQSAPDLILLDVNMPLLNGFDCLVEIKKIQHCAHVPVFMLSTSGSPRDIDRAFKNGARKFLTKPNSYTAICVMMNEIIEECLHLK